MRSDDIPNSLNTRIIQSTEINTIEIASPVKKKKKSTHNKNRKRRKAKTVKKNPQTNGGG